MYLRRKDREEGLGRRRGSLLPPSLLTESSSCESHGQTLSTSHLTTATSTLVQETEIVCGHRALVVQDHLSGGSGEKRERERFLRSCHGMDVMWFFS